MTRRILLVLLAFTAAVLVAAVVPLTLDAANHDRASYIQATAGMVTTDAAIAQALLDAMYQNLDQSKADGAPLVTLITQTQDAGDGLLIFKDNAKSLVERVVPPPGEALLDQAVDAATEYFAARGELDPGRGCGCTRRTEPRSAYGRGGRAHSRLQHGVPSLGV